ncbi:RHS repeat-associated core domain-containing protein, partial [Brucella sp. TWI432]
LMRFNAPDSLSPFGQGGVNPYAYCQGDPINFADPSGHVTVGQGFLIGAMVLSAIIGIGLGYSAYTDISAMAADTVRASDTGGAGDIEENRKALTDSKIKKSVRIGVKVAGATAAVGQIATGTASLIIGQNAQVRVLHTLDGDVTQENQAAKTSKALAGVSGGLFATMIAMTAWSGIDALMVAKEGLTVPEGGG